MMTRAIPSSFMCLIVLVACQPSSTDGHVANLHGQFKEMIARAYEEGEFSGRVKRRVGALPDLGFLREVLADSSSTSAERSAAHWILAIHGEDTKPNIVALVELATRQHQNHEVASSLPRALYMGYVHTRKVDFLDAFLRLRFANRDATIDDWNLLFRLALVHFPWEVVPIVANVQAEAERGEGSEKLSPPVKYLRDLASTGRAGRLFVRSALSTTPLDTQAHRDAVQQLSVLVEVKVLEQ